MADAVFTVDFRDEATHTGWVELPEDALEVDNRRYFTVQSLQAIKVHAIRNQARSQGAYQKTETFFMKMAFAAGADAVPIDFSESTTVPTAETLARTDVLILADVPRFSSAEAGRIKNYVNAGGGLILTVGDNLDVDAYKQHLGSSSLTSGDSGELGLMPCNFVQAVGDALDRQQFRVLATVEYDHPIFASFKEPNHGDFGKARFYRFYQAVPAADATVIAAYDDGSPALFEKPYGDLGRVLCFTSTIDRDWNDLPIRAVYLPFLHESIKYLALKNVDATPDYRIGDSIELNVGMEGQRTQRNRAVAVFNPNNVETRLQPDENNTTTSVFYTDTVLPGIYSVHASGAEAHYFVVNIDATESDLASRDVEELKSMLKGTADESTEDKPTTELIAQYHEDVEKRQDIWMYLMLVVFALAVTEMFLANRV